MMNSDLIQTNESHASVLNSEEDAAVAIPKDTNEEQVTAETEDVGSEDKKEDTQPVDCEDPEMLSSNTNNQNATSALEEDAPFSDSVKDVLIELERDPPVFQMRDNPATSPTNSQSQDIDPNTNESNNTNVSSCEVLSPTFEEGSHVVDISSDIKDNRMQKKARQRSRSRRRSSSVRQKNSSAFTPRRKSSNTSNTTSKARQKVNSRKGSTPKVKRSNSRGRSSSYSNKRRRGRN